MINNKKIIWYWLAFVSLFFWSIHAVIIRYLVFENDISPISISFLRFFIWWLFLLIISYIFYKKSNFDKILKEEKIYKKDYFLLPVFFLTFNFIVFHWWLEYTLASNSILIEALSPVLVVLITMFFFMNKINNINNLKRIFMIVILWSVWSTLIVANLWNDWILQNKLIWDMLEFVAMIFFAFFIVFNHELRFKTKDYPWIIITWLLLLFWSFLILPFAMFNMSSLFDISLKDFYLILLLSIWSTWLSYLFRFLASKYLNVITLALLFNVVWITTILVEKMVFPDINFITYKLIIWASLILIASSMVEFLNKKN